MNTSAEDSTLKQPSSNGIVAFVERHHLALIFLLLIVATIPLGMVINTPVHGDVELYRGVGQSLAKGIVPYRDRELEYPPYAIPFFLAPWLVTHEPKDFKVAFGAFVILVDSLLKMLLLWE